MNGTIACLEVEYAERISWRSLFLFLLLLASLQAAYVPTSLFYEGAGLLNNSTGALENGSLALRIYSDSACTNSLYSRNATVSNGSWQIAEPNISAILEIGKAYWIGVGFAGQNATMNQPNGTSENCTQIVRPVWLAFNLTTPSFQSNESYVGWEYGSATAGSDEMIIGTMFGLALAAAIFAYLYTQAASYVWKQVWFFFTCLMVMAVLMALNSFAVSQADSTLQNVSFALLLGFVWVFLIALWIFLLTLLKNGFAMMKGVWDGRKARKSQ